MITNPEVVMCSRDGIHWKKENRQMIKLITLMALPTFLLVGLTKSSPVSGATGKMNITEDTALTEDHFGNNTIEANGITLDCNGVNIISCGFGFDILCAGRSDVTVTAIKRLFQNLLNPYRPEKHYMRGRLGAFPVQRGQDDY